ncbi:hypothetical protein Angca_001512, partial [Angiostrongylus cantonensis]
MCVALILLMNSFYKVYYWLFDLCEHALVSALILATVLIFFLPVFFSLKSEEHRPLFTIAVLVSGVVGGLAVVIAVVYLYRFCLKKRPPVTTTVLPEAKREQIRSNAISQSRPLPLPLYADTNTPLISHSSTKEYMKERAVEEESVLGSPTRIAKVFPLIRKEQAVPYIQRSAQDLSQNKSFLSVSGGPLRARSVDVLETDPNSETRRASFDVQRGTGRQLPSTEGLE